jgi:hypothetical protein
MIVASSFQASRLATGKRASLDNRPYCQTRQGIPAATPMVGRPS